MRGVIVLYIVYARPSSISTFLEGSLALVELPFLSKFM